MRRECHSGMSCDTAASVTVGEADPLSGWKQRARGRKQAPVWPCRHWRHRQDKSRVNQHTGRGLKTQALSPKVLTGCQLLPLSGCATLGSWCCSPSSFKGGTKRSSPSSWIQERANRAIRKPKLLLSSCLFDV